MSALTIGPVSAEITRRVTRHGSGSSTGQVAYASFKATGTRIVAKERPRTARVDQRMEERTMKLSTRNQLSGVVTDVKLGTIMSEITVDVGGQTIVAAITRGSAEHLELAAGDKVTVLIKATEVMLGK